MLPALLSIVPSIIGGIADHFKDKRELKKVETEAQLALKKAITESNIQKVLNGQAHDIRWAEEMAQASQTSWKDEYWTLVISIPAIMSFIPGLSHYVELGFHALNATPEWYQLVLLVAVGASFGVRLWGKTKETFNGHP